MLEFLVVAVTTRSLAVVRVSRPIPLISEASVRLPIEKKK